MEFCEKLQMFRKQKGITQEELAKALYVSRAAVSKWESGRGYPSIDSLKAIAQFFSVTVDELLSSEEVLSAAQEDQKQRDQRFCDWVFGLIDCASAMILFLPFFAQRVEGTVSAVSLLALNSVNPYVKAIYMAAVLAIAAWGMTLLALRACDKALWARQRQTISIALNAAGELLFMLSPQPYAAALLFVFLAIKGIFLVKRR